MRRHLLLGSVVAMLIGVLASCNDSAPVSISIGGVPFGGVEGGVTSVSRSETEVSFFVARSAKDGAGRADGAASAEVTIKGINTEALSEALSDFDMEEVDELSAKTRFSPTGPSTRVSLYRDGNLVAVVVDNGGRREVVLDELRLEPGARLSGDAGSVPPPSPRREFVDAVLKTGDTETSVETLEPRVLESGDSRWRFILLAATVPSRDTTSQDKPEESDAPSVAAPDGELSNEEAPFSADWVMYRVE